MLCKFKVFTFEGVKIALGKIDDNRYVGYSFALNRAFIRGSAKEVVDDIILFCKYRYIFEVFDMN